MWKQIHESTKDLLLLSRELQQNKEDIKEVKQDVKTLRAEVQKIRDDFAKLTLFVQKLSFDIQRYCEREQSERREMTLKLENEMLKFERRRPFNENKFTE